MTTCGLALDIGTNGLRCQAIDLETEETAVTIITQCHPISGMNVINHANYAKSGEENATGLICKCANQLFHALGIDLSKVVRIGVYGNMFQMSLFQGIEIRGLVYAGKNICHHPSRGQARDWGRRPWVQGALPRRRLRHER